MLYGAALPAQADDFVLSTLGLEGSQQLDDKGMLEQAAVNWAHGKAGEPYYVYHFPTMFQDHTEEQAAFHSGSVTAFGSSFSFCTNGQRSMMRSALPTALGSALKGSERTGSGAL